MIENDWWKSYFREGWEPIQHFVKTPYNTDREAGFVELFMRRLRYKSLLDVPSGSGRISIEMAKRGYKTCGLEYNPDAVAAAYMAAAAHQFEHAPTFLLGDMRQMTFVDEFDMVASIFNSFGYFDDADNIRFLQGVAQALKPGGGFLLDTHLLESLLPIWTEKGFWRFDDLLVLEEREWDTKTSRMNGHWTFVYPDGSQKYFDSSVRVYGCKELSDIMANLGFGPPKIYSSYDGQTFQMGHDGAILFFRKLK